MDDWLEMTKMSGGAEGESLFPGQSSFLFFPVCHLLWEQEDHLLIFKKFIYFSLHRILFFLKKVFIFYWRIIASRYGVGLCHASV